MLRVARGRHVRGACEHRETRVFRKSRVHVRVLAAIEHRAARRPDLPCLLAAGAQADTRFQRFSVGYQWTGWPAGRSTGGGASGINTVGNNFVLNPSKSRAHSLWL